MIPPGGLAVNSPSLMPTPEAEVDTVTFPLSVPVTDRSLRSSKETALFRSKLARLISIVFVAFLESEYLNGLVFKFPPKAFAETLCTLMLGVFEKIPFCEESKNFIIVELNSRQKFAGGKFR